MTDTTALDKVFSDRLLIKPSEAARLIGISLKTLRAHVAKGEMSYRNLGLRPRPIMRFAREDIEEFLENRKSRSSGPLSPTPTRNIRSAGKTPTPRMMSFTELQEQRAKEREARRQKKREGK